VRGVPNPRYVPPSDFLSLSAVCSTSWRHGLVSSRNHVQGSSRSGASPSVQPPSVSGGACPHAVATPIAHRPSTASTFDVPRLRGLHPHGEALPRVRCLASPSLAPLVGFCPPPGLMLILRAGSPARSAHEVAAQARGAPPTSTAFFSVFPMNTRFGRLRPNPTCSRFRATNRQSASRSVLLQGLPLVRCPGRPGQSAHEVHCLGLRSPARLDSLLQRLSNESLVRPSPVEPTCSRFEPRLGSPIR
jgi:hypothetical protein